MANDGGPRLEAVTKDQLNTAHDGPRAAIASASPPVRVSVGIKKPFVHVTGYFVSGAAPKIASFEARQRRGRADGGTRNGPSAVGFRTRR